MQFAKSSTAFFAICNLVCKILIGIGLAFSRASMNFLVSELGLKACIPKLFATSVNFMLIPIIAILDPAHAEARVVWNLEVRTHSVVGQLCAKLDTSIPN